MSLPGHSQLACSPPISEGASRKPQRPCVVYAAAARPTIPPIIHPPVPTYEDTTVNKAEKIPCPPGAATPVGETSALTLKINK